MGLFLILLLVLALYLRTLGYKYVIDDNVVRGGYLFDVPLTAPPAELHTRGPDPIYRLFMIGMHCVNVSIIYMLWGWAPALLFAVHPLSVWGVCWVTGNYYATAAYFTFISYFILHQFPNVWGALAAMPIFAAALNSTVCPMSFPFVFLFTGTPWGLSLFIPLAFFFWGRRFKAGIAIRYRFNKDNKLVDMKFTWKRIFLMTKVTSEYIKTILYPKDMGFFGPFGYNIRHDKKKYDQVHSADDHFWISLALCLMVLGVGIFVNWEATVWFFVLILLHSQWNLTGQFYAQRYLYISMVGLCVIAGTLLSPFPIAITAVATLLAIRTWQYTPAWKNIENMYRNDLRTWPEHCECYNNVAQYFLNRGGMTSSQLNEVISLLLRAEELNPKAWSIQMNLAAFYSMTNQNVLALEKTNVALALYTREGGLSGPADALKKQRISLKKAMQLAADKQNTDVLAKLNKDMTDLAAPGGIDSLFKSMIEQKNKLEKLVKEAQDRAAKEAAIKQRGAILSPHAQQSRKREDNHGKRKRKDEGVPEPVGDPEPNGGKE